MGKRFKHQLGRGSKMNTLYHEWVADMHLVNLSGALNISRKEEVIQLFKALFERGVERVVVNLEDVPFIDGQGLAALITAYRIFGSDAQNFRLAGIQDQPRLVFELTGFDRVFQISPRSYIRTQPGWASPAFALPSVAMDLAV
jgi:anti-anti-sigma factor